MAKTLTAIFVLVAFTALLLSQEPEEGAENAHQETTAAIFVDGQLQRPVGYRRWVFVGTPLTPNDMNDGKAAFPEFHNVYIDPASFDVYEKTGKYPEGTTIVKELVSVGSKAAVSGKGYFMGEYLGLEALVKSAKQFPDEPGNWAFFSFTNPEGELKKQAPAFPSASCNSCHQAAAAEDWVFSQYYPVLRAAKASKKTM